MSKTRSATTDYVTLNATVDVCNRTDCVAHDWHRLVDKLAIFIQRCCAFFVQRNVWFSQVQNFVAGLVNVVSIYENANGNENRQRYY